MNSNTLIGAAIGAGAVGLGLLGGWLLFGGETSTPAPAASQGGVSSATAPLTGIAAAEAAYGQGDLETAFNLLVPLAEGGDALAMQRIGYMYSEGLFVQRDIGSAIEWLERAVDAGNDNARTLLVQLLNQRAESEGGAGAQAVADLERAAALGDPQAQAVIGSYYLVGAEGLPRDPARAIELLTVAGEAGDVRAQSNLGYVYATGTGADVDHEQARYWYQQAAEAGMVRAQVAYASYLQRGLGGEENFAEAVRYYINAAEGGSDLAQRQLGLMIVEERMVAPDAVRGAAFVSALARGGDARGLEWLEARASQGDGAAAFRLGTLLEDGEGAPQDSARARALFAEAAQAGDPGAQLRMSNIMAAGVGGEPDYVEAHKWANLAAAQGLEAAVRARSSLAELMTAEQLAQAQARATEWTETRRDAEN